MNILKIWTIVSYAIPIYFLWICVEWTLAKRTSIIGHLMPTDKLILNQTLFIMNRKKSKISHTFHYTQKTDPRVISAIVLNNYEKSAFGSEAVLLEGGPNNIYCALKISARKGKNINYTISIYTNNKTLVKTK